MVDITKNVIFEVTTMKATETALSIFARIGQQEWDPPLKSRREMYFNSVVFSRPFILIATPFFDFVDFECIFYQSSSSSYSLPSERATPSKPNTTNRFNSKTYFSDCSKFYHTHIDTLSWPDTKRLWSADIERLPVVVFCSIICLTPL